MIHVLDIKEISDHVWDYFNIFSENVECGKHYPGLVWFRRLLIGWLYKASYQLM